MQPREDSSSWVVDIVQALEDGDLDLVRRLFTSFLADPRRVFLVGASFSSQTGTVEEWQME